MMKKFQKILFCTAFLLFTINTFSQSNFAPSTKRFWYDFNQFPLSKSKNLRLVSKDFISEYALFYRNNLLIIGVLVLVNDNEFNSQKLKEFGVLNYRKINQIYSFRIPVNQLLNLTKQKGVLLIDVGDDYSQDLDRSIKTSRVDSVHSGLANLNKIYKGKGVVVAVIDWGFDYTHPMFYDSVMLNYRIVRAWDQNRLSGPSPKGFDFGTAYETKEALLNAKEDTLYVFGPGSHGTHVAGIAAGAGAGTNKIGMAPESELIFISLRRDAVSLIDAYHYISQYAKSVNKPFVVNMSFGNHLGPHDGTTLENIGIDAFAGKGRILVGSAGNNGNNNFHLQHQFKNNNDTLKTVVNFATGLAEYYGQTLSMWSSKNTHFSLRLRLMLNNQTEVLKTIWFNSNKDTVFTQKFYSSSMNDSIEVRITSTSSFVTNQKSNIRLEVKKYRNLKLVAEMVSNNQCLLHLWNNVKLDNRHTNWGTDLSSDFPNAKAGNVLYGLGEPAGVGKNIITVASYKAEFKNPVGTFLYGQISNYSSYGPTVDERRKPDITGAGQDVESSVNSYDPNPGNIITTVNFNNRNYHFVQYSGTSMSGPALAGIVALLLQMNPTLTHEQMKTILKNTARLDQYTKNIADTGSLVWGWGKINALAALQYAQNIPHDYDFVFQEYSVFPNPSSGIASFIIKEKTELQIFDDLGNLIISENYDFNVNPYQINLSELSDGVYFFKFITNHETKVVKWVRG